MPLPAFVALALKLTPVVPLVTRWLSGDNPGPIADKVISVAQAISGAETPEQAVNAILGDPAKQQAFALAMQDRTDEMERAYLADRQSARERDVKIVQIKGKNQRADNLAYLAAFALLGCLIGLFAPWEIPESNEKLLYLVVGALIVIVKDVYGFEFGTSKNAERNVQMVADYVKNGSNKPR